MSVNDRDNHPDEPAQPARASGSRRRRYLNRRNVIIATIAASVGVVALILLVVLVYRLGYVDQYVATQIKRTFANYGIRAEIREFHTSFPPETVEMLGLELFDAQTGERLGKIDRMRATVRVEDLYALSLERNIDLKDLQIEGLEAWITFDEQGRSNFRNIRVPPPEPNRRILFSYSTARIEIKSGVIHYGDERHEISGEARNLKATIQPDDPRAPDTSWMNSVTLSVTDSTFTYDGRPVNDIDVQVRARVNQTQAEIQELIIKSPLAEARLHGTMDDWRALRYQMNVSSTVDLTQLSDVLRPGATLRGAGSFTGKVSGEGDNYKVEGQINSDGLAADGLRLQGLSVTATGSGQGKTYEVNGRAVAQLLTAGDFQLSGVQIVGNVMGTGSDFRWVGELRAAAERSYGTTITDLILRDAQAEYRDGVLTGSSSQFSASNLRTAGASVAGLSATGIRIRNAGDETTANIATVKAGAIAAGGSRIEGVTANNIEATSRAGVTNVVVNNVQVGATRAAGAEVGSLNIAGVRLSVRNGRIEGSTADIDAGSVKLAEGQLDQVKLARPVFVVEPSGRYRASADLSIGGGVLGQMDLGQVRARLTATSSEIELKDFNADVFNGRAGGDARIALVTRGTSRVNARFDGIEISGPLTVLAESPVPLSGTATGSLDLTFPGTDYKQATGTISSTFTAETADAGDDRIPLTGQLALRADRGSFVIDRVDLKTPATTLNATGQFSFSGDSNLQVDLNSSDAAELQAVLISSGLLPDVEEQLRSYGIGLAGQLAFRGNITGRLESPNLDGQFRLGSLLINNYEVGALSAAIKMTPDELRINDGRLAERDGGGMQFTFFSPRKGDSDATLDATLDRVNAATLLAVLPLDPVTREQLGNTRADLSGKINVTGIPDNMSGSADISSGAGTLAGERLESLTARATFTGPNVKIENVDVRLSAGRILASGNVNLNTKQFDLEGRAESVQLDRLATLAGNPSLQNITGVANFSGRIVGNYDASDFSAYQVTFDGEARDVTINGRSAGTLALVGRTENQRLNVSLTTGLLGAPQVITAQVNLGVPELPATLETTLTNADLTTLLGIILPHNTVSMSGRASGTIRASGNLVDEDGYFSTAGLQGTAAFSELTFRVEDVQLAANTPMVVKFSPGEVSFDQAQFTGPGTNITIGGTVAVGPGGRQTLTVDGRLNLRVLNGLSPDFFSTGTADVAVRVTGSYEQPRLNGTASLTGASVSVLLGNERWMVSNLRSLVRFTANQAQIESLTGTMGGGRVNVTGGALLDGIALRSFLINVRGEDITVPYPEGFRSNVDANLEIKGSAREQLIGGVVNVRRAEYTEDIELADLIDFRRTESIEEGGEVEFTRTALFNDLRVEGRNALVVRNNLADLTGSLSLTINGPVKDPVISGRITAISGGTLNFRNDRYEIVRALMDLPARGAAEPVVNIQAESQIRGYRVTVSLIGPISNPQAIVRSDPALPQADVVSLITTGQLAGSDTSTSILSQSGIGTATSLLTDALINAPAQRATSRLFGLSRFEISPVIGGRAGSTPAARLTLGKQINKDLTVTYSTNVTSDPNQILALEYRVSDRLFFVAQYEQASTRELSTRNDSFSFEIRFRKRF